MIVLGSTGSVGEQTLDVARKENIRVTAISANTSVDKAELQAREFKVDFCAMADERSAAELKMRLADTDVKVYSGKDGLCEMTAEAAGEIVVNAIIGKAGLEPTLAVIDSGKQLALANKESLVVAGDIVMDRAAKKGIEVLPVDSEHCAIHQCMKAGKASEVKKILLTASGGPFYGKTRSELLDMTVRQALSHPTWKMGAKITIDSATLMNKGFEVIEAVHLFGVKPENVEVVIHRESIIHSMVEYLDNSIIAHMSVPDMRLCIQYVLNYPDRRGAISDELDLFKLASMNFAKPDTDTFSLLACARKAITRGGALPCVLNAANEVAVDAFLLEKISFMQITDIVGEVVEKMSDASKYTSLEDILRYDIEARGKTLEYIEQK